MKKNRAYLVLVVLIMVGLLTGCKMNVPGAVVKASATPLPEGMQTVEPTDVIAELNLFVTQTAIAQEMLMPPEVFATEVPLEEIETPYPVEEPPVVEAPPPSMVEPLPMPTQGPPPSAYALQKNEFPFCIARRFNVDPAELLALNGLSIYSVYSPGMSLRIPQTGRTFPGNRALMAHPTTYTVGGSETIFSIACTFGDVDPMAIAAVNGLQPPYHLSSGMVLQIP